ncbi:MAG: Gfo/Idh/MocA family oxidoreductase [Kiritimatiellae bacterium]|nr:Gfo/Idh/MocA family oxidoreductase [Kiritimatiellia bacterium]
MANDSVSVKMDGPRREYRGRKLRVAVIGCGGIAQTHLTAYRDALPQVDVVAGVDIRADRLAVMRDKWGLPESALFGADLASGKTRSETAWREMLRKMGDKIDAVDVCTPNFTHCQPVVDCCKAGKHAFVEKPMAMTVEEGKRMVAAAKAGGVKLSVGFQNRYRPALQALVEARENGVFGGILFVKVRRLRRRGIPNWGVFGRRELQGGGPLIDIGVHFIECAYEFMGRPKPVAASGNTWTYLGNRKDKTRVRSPWPGWDWKTYTVEDLAIGHVRFDNGAIMQIETSFAAHIEENDVAEFTAMGTKGGCAFPSGKIFTDQNGTMVNVSPAYLDPAGDEWNNMFSTKLGNWADGCLTGAELGASGEDGLNVQRILNGLYDSAAAGGKEVEIR